jgi:hypothetical protein
VNIEQHSRRASNMRRRHGRSAEESPSGTIVRTASGFAYTRDRAEDIDTDRGQVRLNRQVNIRWTLAAETGEDVSVGSNELLEYSDR